jgi:hypothetical protein
MKRILWMSLLILALPMMAFATSSVDFTNSGGTLSASAGSNPTLSLAGSELIAFNGAGGLATGNLGTLSFTTGALLSGNLMGSCSTTCVAATLAGGGSFVITGDGKGVPNGVIFTGTFSGPVTWTEVTNANGTHNYTLTGSITGTWYTGMTVDGATVQLTINTGKGWFNGSTTISSGDTNIAVPEPGTLELLGTGFVGLAAALRRKLKV